MAALAPDRLLRIDNLRGNEERDAFLLGIAERSKVDNGFERSRFESLATAYEHFHSLAVRDTVELLRLGRAIAIEQRDFARALQRTFLEAANGFQRFLRNRPVGPDPMDADTTARIAALAIDAIHGFVKWSRFLEEPGHSVPWRQLHALLSICEAQECAKRPVSLHAHDAVQTTVQSLYLRTLVLELLDAGSLTASQLEIADGWFFAWCDDFALDVEYSSRQHIFCVDITADAGLELIHKVGHGQTVRYLRADSLKGRLAAMQATLRDGHLYAACGAGASFPVEEHVAVLALVEKLHRSILAASGNRIEERTHFQDREADVVVGTDRLLRKARDMHAGGTRAAAPQANVATQTIEITPSGLSLMENQAEAPAAAAADPDVERWRVFDLSTRGFGLLVDRATADNVPLNGLIGLRNHETGGWIVGTIVRKLPKPGETLIGVEVLAYRPIPVDMVPVGGGDTVPALYLAGGDTSGRLDSLMMRATDFRPDLAYAVKAGGADYRVRANRIVRKGADWIKARFEIEAKA